MSYEKPNKTDIINLIKKYFPEFIWNKDENIVTYKSSEFKIPDFNPDDTYSGILAGIEKYDIRIFNMD